MSSSPRTLRAMLNRLASMSAPAVLRTHLPWMAQRAQDGGDPCVRRRGRHPCHQLRDDADLLRHSLGRNYWQAGRLCLERHKTKTFAE